ncbi:MAG: COX15/CtaA family protein [Rhodospirillales bacterium]|nr:COX15/CtaA family protein [Rhodospirillales bacterium]
MRSGAAMAPGDRRAVAIWLMVVAALVFGMVVLGGVTRLTESGLSMTDWNPVTGWIPPLSEPEWQEEFEKYRASPEYRQINRGMALADFKTIFWYEFWHRVLGRIIGLAFLVPFMVFLFRKRLDPPMTRRLWLLFVLGGLQGLVGWFMVKSGLVDRPSVSQYRLAMHLGLAFLIYGMLVWTIAGLLHTPDYGSAEPGIARPRRGVGWLLALVSVTIVSGAFVAGLDAGLYYNTFPLMDGRVVPADYLADEPWWLNPFQNVAAVQFNHRLLAIATVVAIFATWFGLARSSLTTRTRLAARALAAMAVLQALIGVMALLAYVPVWLGALHQIGALVLFTLTILLLDSLRQREAQSRRSISRSSDRRSAR